MRQDLYFRLSVLVIDLPPLRARLDDLPLLVHAILQRLRGRGIVVETVEPAVLGLLAEHTFPGNIRELENLIEGVAITLTAGQATIGVDEVRAWLRSRGQGGAASGRKEDGLLPIRLDELETWAIKEALRRTHGNKRQAAQLLGISRDTLYRKLEEADPESVMPEFRAHQ
jgi:transcriptional regulator with PAS, ATPase and Fis domain